MSRRPLTEALRRGDLAGHVRPCVEIDRHEPRLDPRAVVVAFACDDPRVAFDLARYLFHDPEPTVLDVDFTDLPDDTGHWWTYAECRRDRRTPERLVALFERLQPAVGPMRWTALIGPKAKRPVPCDVPTLTRMLDLARPDGDAVLEAAGLDRGLVDADGRLHADRRFRPAAVGPVDILLDALRRSGRRPSLDEAASAVGLRLDRLLPPGWIAWLADDVLVLSDGQQAVLAVREAEPWH